ncbi:putative phospholipase D [Helianthus anomalus]
MLAQNRKGARNLGVNDQPYPNDQDPEGWHIFRSIDSNSVKGFPKDLREATTKVDPIDSFPFS